ncbi:hypothetical protein HQN86_00500 [Pedobacter panaciterrae]|uniref:hypothetical protein n=1 Tax=Pedobacter panaciterrae TaxID=363849 RepID=UPI00155D923A|nr:hypothetical protein [Pedobacter panaciterrae]NQX52082.1 hypothetical protein [Pedobacter panaciterrae]
MRYLKALLSIVIVGFTVNGFAQESKKQIQTKLYRTILQIDSSKADTVWQIQDSYKANLSLIMADTTLHGIRRERKIHALMNNRNEKLKRHLGEVQLKKIISPTERIIDNNR